jgi:4-diphosphocytidyl-2-C-methyl-D-erythritol kinase
LIYPGFGISTKWAYGELAKFPEIFFDKSKSVSNFVEILKSKTIEEAAPYFYNVLEKPAFKKYPILEIYKDFNKENGAAVSLMSGSGSTVFAILKSKDDTDKLIAKFQSKFGFSNWIAIAQL